MTPDTSPLGPDEPTIADKALIAASGLDLRRAVLAVLLRARKPMGVGEIVRLLGEVEQVDTEWITARARWFQPFDPGRTQPDVGKVVADLLRHQVAYGRVVRVSRGVYAIKRSGLSLSTAHRCLNWRRIRDGQIRGR